MNTTLTPPTTPEAPQTPPPARRSSAALHSRLYSAMPPSSGTAGRMWNRNRRSCTAL